MADEVFGAAGRRRLDVSELPRCRACGCPPYERLGRDGVRVMCPSCGIGSAPEWDDQAAMAVWADAMGGPGTAAALMACEPPAAPLTVGEAVDAGRRAERRRGCQNPASAAIAGSVRPGGGSAGRGAETPCAQGAPGKEQVILCEKGEGR